MYFLNVENATDSTFEYYFLHKKLKEKLLRGAGSISTLFHTLRKSESVTGHMLHPTLLLAVG